MSDRIGRLIKGNADRPIFGYNCPDNEIEPHSARLLRRGGDRDLYGISQCISGSNNVTNTFKGQLVKKSDKGVYYVENPCCQEPSSSGSMCLQRCFCPVCKPDRYYATIQSLDGGFLSLMNGRVLILNYVQTNCGAPPPLLGPINGWGAPATTTCTAAGRTFVDGVWGPGNVGVVRFFARAICYPGTTISPNRYLRIDVEILSTYNSVLCQQYSTSVTIPENTFCGYGAEFSSPNIVVSGGSWSCAAFVTGTTFRLNFSE